MHIRTCVNSKYNAKSNDSDHIFVIRENTRLKHRCPFFSFGVTFQPCKLYSLESLRKDIGYLIFSV